MRILLTNDDGIRHPGLAAMFDALVDPRKEFGGPLVDNRDTTTRAPRSVVYPVAPQTVQSATSHGVTFHEPLMTRVERLNERMEGVAVDGRPADCTKLAISAIWPERFGEGSRPDLVISGINSGANVGVNVIYSGTVAAALEAAFLGVPAIAVSLQIGKGQARYDVAARYARGTVERIVAGGLPRPHECLSINIPVTESEGPTPGVRVCPPGGDVYYWASGHGLDFHATSEGSDVDLLFKRFITVTPLTYDLTRHAELERWGKVLG
jgi:5'-nucleotidase